jgi:UDP-N-acetylglucosamine transferase subunit ALG13
MARILVTVGMGPLPFDRLVAAVHPLCAYHDVFVQTGTSAVVPPCPHADYVPLDEMQRRIDDADVVVTHAGSTVRLVQRLDRVPVVVARRRRLGEAIDDEQERYLRAEEQDGRAYALWDTGALPAAVAQHPTVAARLLATRPLPSPVSDEHLINVLDEVTARLLR